MRCPVCGALYLFHTDNSVFTCSEGHEWHWNEETHTVTVRAPRERSRWYLTVETPGNGDVARWEGEGGHV